MRRFSRFEVFQPTLASGGANDAWDDHALVRLEQGAHSSSLRACRSGYTNLALLMKCVYGLIVVALLQGRLSVLAHIACCYPRGADWPDWNGRKLSIHNPYLLQSRGSRERRFPSGATIPQPHGRATGVESLSTEDPPCVCFRPKRATTRSWTLTANNMSLGPSKIGESGRQ